jgi:hypothetical protein
MLAKLNDKLIRVCMEHSKIQALNEAKEASSGIAHVTDKIDIIANKLHQIHDIAKIISSNTEANYEINAQATIANEQIHSRDALDVINARLDQIFDKLTQVTAKPRQTIGESEQVIYRFMDTVTSFEKMINELNDPERDTKLLLEQLNQSVDGLTHAANQLTQAIDESVLTQFQN